jgi:interferon gamma-inducible protein 30
MDSRRRLLILALFVSIVAAASAMKAAVRSSSAEKVKVAMYYETLCPYCENFIVNNLYQIFENGLIDIVDLKLSPYGNAKIGPNNTITCQHGPYECLLNTIEACALHIWPDVKEHFPFIFCLEKLVYEGKPTEWETCFATLNIDPKPVTECYTSGLGNKLELELAADTNALQPRHTYVPWVTLNGRPLYDDYYVLQSRICRAYKGDDKPDVCDELSARSTKKKISNSGRSVCYKEESKKSTLIKISSVIGSFFRNINTEAAI